eukprot:s1033_g13.t1
MQATRGSIMPIAAEKRGAVAVQVGDAVFVGDQKLTGVVRFSGTTKFAEGEWLGIELDKKVGKNNGSVRGEVYFQCAPEHGIFVRPTAVMKRGDVAAVASPLSPAAGVKPPGSEGAATPSSPTVPEAKTEAKAAKETKASEEVVASDRAKAQLDLAMAMEDHDLNRIKRFLPVAQNLGVAPEEIAAARKLLEYETLVVAIEDVKRLYGSIAKLTQRVEELQNKSQAPLRPALLQELERRLWSRVEAKLTKMLEGRVRSQAATNSPATSMHIGKGILSAAATTLVDSEAKDTSVFSSAGRRLLEAATDSPGQDTTPGAESESPLKQIVRGTLHGVFSAAGRKLIEEKKFEEVDKDGDGVISQAEITATLAEMKIVGQEVEEAQKQIMQMADKDGDGVISKQELDQAKEKVTSEDPKPPVAEAAHPKDAEAKDSKEEAEASHYQLVRGTLASILSGAAKRFVETKSFEEVDKDGDGVITQQEITASLTEMQVDSKEAEEAKQQIISMADKDGDGVISKKELDEAKAVVAGS